MKLYSLLVFDESTLLFVYLLNFVNNARFIIVNIFISGFMMRHFM